MSPIYVRPEREQAEHDRLIRFLQEKYSHRFEALANPGDERVAPLKIAAVTHFPDLVLHEDKRPAGVVEIETAASVNNLETMAKWVPFSKARVPFHLYVPVQGYEAALRLVEAHRVKAAEIWTYRPAMEGFDLVRMFADPALQEVRAARTAAAKAGGTKAGTATPRKVAARPAKPEPRTRTSRPARPVRAVKKATKASPATRSKPATAKSAAKPAAAKRVVRPARAATKAARGKKTAGARRSR
ncbi:MAG: hypothetical protein ABS36_14720 [Acidobacteria bacterium SCN 69-37]|nr:MAG: hypothetical protein ABS36_14720 [Acidobacteria bacterium SCN 69-37]